MIRTARYLSTLSRRSVYAGRPALSFVFALVCALASLAFAAPADTLRFHPGLRNSGGSHQLHERQLRTVLESLRGKTGFLELRFDEAGFLTLGDRSRIIGGSATARELLIAAVDGDKVFELESHDSSPYVAFANIGGGEVVIDFATNARVEVQPLRLDFTDFAQLRGKREALEAFDIGFAVLHELAHGVWGLRDEVTDKTRLGACDEYVNRARRELGLPERKRYRPRINSAPSSEPRATVRAELLFVLASKEYRRSGRHKFYLRWDAKQVAALDGRTLR